MMLRATCNDRLSINYEEISPGAGRTTNLGRLLSLEGYQHPLKSTKKDFQTSGYLIRRDLHTIRELWERRGGGGGVL